MRNVRLIALEAPYVGGFTAQGDWCFVKGIAVRWPVPTGTAGFQPAFGRHGTGSLLIPR